MKPTENTPPRDPSDPERLLRARLCDTTPAFEARFDDLRRRLAQEPAGSSWHRFWNRFSARGAWISAASAIAAIVVAVVLWPTRSAIQSLTPAQQATYGHIVELDDALRDARPLTDPELLEALLLMPVSQKG
jgi:hypothetical protein